MKRNLFLKSGEEKRDVFLEKQNFKLARDM